MIKAVFFSTMSPLHINFLEYFYLIFIITICSLNSESASKKMNEIQSNNNSVKSNKSDFLMHTVYHNS